MTNALNIPGWKNKIELNVAAALVKECNVNSIIVEIGASAGRITWILSENAPSGSIIYAIDQWHGLHKFTGKGYLLDSKKTNTMDYFLHFLNDRIDINVKPIIGNSLTMTWDKEIDLIIIDPDNGFGKTNLCDHLEKWYPYVKQNGIIAGYNFYHHRTDVINQVVSFSKKYNLKLEIDNKAKSWKFKK